jgi:PEP-CTERM motif
MPRRLEEPIREHVAILKALAVPARRCNGLTAQLEIPPEIPGASQFFSYPTSGAITFEINGTDSSAKDLANLIGTGRTSLILGVFGPAEGPATIAGPDLTGAITYVYTPIPEPASLTLLGFGFAGLALIRRRKRPQASADYPRARTPGPHPYA